MQNVNDSKVPVTYGNICGKGMTPWPYCQLEVAKTAEAAAQYALLYPEVFYKLQPYVLEACDQMEAYGYTIPTKDMVEQMSLGICSDACKMYPELTAYINPQWEGAGAKEGITAQEYDRSDRGLFRDLVDILLLTELFGRRRRYYY